MRIAGLLENSLVNGKGLRFVIFTQGCSHHCPGCHNQKTWNFNNGKDMPIEDVIKKIKESMPLIKGVTLSGGDPLDQPEETYKLLKIIKEDLKLNVWVYTGYTLKEVKNDLNKSKCLKYIDTIVDGKFIKNLYDPKLKYRGSSNQNIINIQEIINNEHN